MSEQLRNQYNSLYSTDKNVFGMGQPITIVTHLNKYLPNGTVLDIGGGQGRNAFYLAQQGFTVSVIDLSAVGLSQIQSIATRHNLPITTQTSDVVTDGIAETFDSIILSFVLHHLDTDAATYVIKTAKQQTTKNGLHAISTFINRGGLYERNVYSKRFYPSKEQLLSLYADWDIKEVYIEEVCTLARNKSGERMRNDVISLIAQHI
jgi:tellurite methyltransferase